MPNDIDHLVRRLIGGDPSIVAEVLDRAEKDTTPVLLVAAALVADEPTDLLARAGQHAATTRDRQLVAIAAAHRDANHDLLDALVRDHLSDHPDSILAAWIATQPAGRPAGTNPQE